MEKKFFITKTEIIIKFIELDDNLQPMSKTRHWQNESLARKWAREELSKRKVYNVSFTKNEKLELRVIDSNGNVF